MIKSWSDAAWEDFEYWMKQDKKILLGGDMEHRELPEQLDRKVSSDTLSA